MSNARIDDDADWQLIRVQLRVAQPNICRAMEKVPGTFAATDLALAKDAIEHAWGHMPPECGQEDEARHERERREQAFRLPGQAVNGRRHFNPFDDDERYNDAPDPSDPSNDITCNRCGKAGLEWYDTGVGYKLWDVEADRLHVCGGVASADEFPDLS